MYLPKGVMYGNPIIVIMAPPPPPTVPIDTPTVVFASISSFKSKITFSFTFFLHPPSPALRSPHSYLRVTSSLLSSPPLRPQFKGYDVWQIILVHEFVSPLSKRKEKKERRKKTKQRVSSILMRRERIGGTRAIP